MSVQTVEKIHKTAGFVAGTEVSAAPQVGGGRGYQIVKRVFDFFASLVASLILLIPMVLIALLIFVMDPGNPFFVQERVGYRGKRIKVVKFRSMKKNADNLEQMLTPDELTRYRKEYKLDRDPRLLGYKPGKKGKCFGELIRKCSIDEIPQIPFNVLLWGNMSLVGPRPILQEELEANYTPEEQEMLLSVRPGVSGYWQSHARNNATYASGKRQEMELYYVRSAGIKLDLRILLATVAVVITGEGAK